MKNAFAYALSITTLSTTGGEGIEQSKHVGHVSMIMRLVTGKDGNLTTYFDTIDDIQNRSEGSSLNRILNDNHEDVSNRGKVQGLLLLVFISVFAKLLEKLQKN